MTNTTTSDNQPPLRSTRNKLGKRLGIWLGVMLGFFVLFGLLGYFWLPGFAKDKAEEILSRELNRPVSIQAIEFKPYTLELLIHGFRIGEKSVVADTLFSFERLYIDLSTESIVRLAPVVTVVTLTGPRFHLRREKSGLLNISDLFEKFGQQQPPEEVVDDGESLFSVSNIQIIDGYFEFDDRVADSIQRIAAIHIGIPFLANFESEQSNWVEPYFNALVNDAPFALAGKARPFMDDREANLTLTLDDIDLTAITGYVPLPPGIHLLSGYLNSDLQLMFLQPTGAAPRIELSGNLVLKQLAVENMAVASPYDVKLARLDVRLQAVHLAAEPVSKLALTLADLSLTAQDTSQSVLQLPALSIGEIGINRSMQEIEVDNITLTHLSASLQRLKSGVLDWQLFFESVPYVAGARRTEPSDHQTPKSIAASTPIPASKPVIVKVIPLPMVKPDYVATMPTPPMVKPDYVATVPTVIIPVPARKPDATSAIASTAIGVVPDKPDDKWKVTIGQINLVDAGVRFEDLTLPKVVPMITERVNLTLDHVDLTGSKPLTLAFEAIVNQRGHIDIQGSFAWNPLLTTMTLDFKNIDLVSLQGWAEDQHHTLLTKGDFSFQGNINAQANKDDPIGITVDGAAQLADFNVLDKRNSAELLRWKSIDFSAIHFDSATLHTDIETIALNDFFARLLLTPSGKLNLGDIVRQDETSQTDPAETTAAMPSPAPAAETGELPIRIDRISLRNGNINFTDQFIRPNYRANLTGLKGQIGPVHSGKITTIDILGAVDRSAPLAIKGKGDFLGNRFFLDLTATAKGIDMPSFSPYSGKYVGYAIKKGKLSVDVNYHVENEQLSAQNEIFLDQLTLGDKVDSPDAVSLPLNLAISLLQNRRGEINLHLPLSGSINDPQFSIGGIIWEAFINILTKAATAPFALLGSLLGDGESLSELGFSPGHAVLEEDALQQLQSLSQILQDRPGLNLEITGLADPVYDHDELKRALLKQRVRNRKVTETAKKGQASDATDGSELSDDDYARYLEAIYEDETFEKPKNFIGLTKSLPVAEMEELILMHTEISEDDLRTLAEQRANAAYVWLVEQGKISNERIFLLSSNIEASENSRQQNNRVQFSVR
ncbi:MAG: DUF748 domain-containing protein [Nitrosomonas sp.]|nr:DUF748 domain-containing protein [Nitrosomonas sp.]